VVLGLDHEGTAVALNRFVLAHEHLALNFFDHIADSSRMLAWTRDSLKRATKAGVREVWDLTNQTIGRDLRVLASLADDCNITVVSSTGHYLDRFHPDDARYLSIDELAKRWVQDLGTTVGSVRVGIIGEIATSKDQATEAEHRALLASVIAQRETGAIIYTHTTFGTLAAFHRDVLLDAGAITDRVVIGHADMFHAVQDVLDVLRSGLSVGIDTIGKENFLGLDGVTYSRPDADRIQLVRSLVEAGYERQILFSSDLLFERGELALNPHTFGTYGYAYIAERFLSELSTFGVSDGAIEAMAGQNAHRMFALSQTGR